MSAIKAVSAQHEENFFHNCNKAQVLAALAGQVKTARILPQVSFTVAEWLTQSDSLIEKIFGQDFSKKALIVRSSSAAEDSETASMAGAFDSVLGVTGPKDTRAAIETVISSYGKGRPGDMVFVQPLLENTIASGVVFTFDPNSGAPYYVIDYIEDSDTTAITAGTSGKGRTQYVHHTRPDLAPALLKPVVSLCRELQDLTGHSYLDIEFAIGEDKALYLFQVRPLVALKGVRDNTERHTQALKEAAALVARLNNKKPYTAGKNTLLGSMPDWNPAEMIGMRPRPLALSMYKEMITDRIWAYQRDKYGYKNLRSAPLLYALSGCPFIDVRASFNSFIPKMVSEKLSSRLMEYYISKLEAEPELHDKVEFDIVFSCYTPSTPKNVEALRKHGFSDTDITEILLALRDLTNRMTHTETGEWRVDRGKIDILRQRQKKMQGSEYSPYDKLFWLTEDCKRYGTLAFAGLARAAFVATQFLRSLRDEGLLAQDRFDAFWQSLETIGGNLKRDHALADRETFLSRYGHLRPGTYDILSESYEEAPEKYFEWKDDKRSAEKIHEAQPFHLTASEDRAIQKMLDDHGLQHTSESLFRFFRAAIEGREYGKFVFSWSINEILKQLLVIGKEQGFGCEDCSFLNFQTLLGNYSYSEPLARLMHRSIEAGREQYETTLQITLPNLIRTENDIWSFEVVNSTPNFVTLGQVQGKIFMVTQETNHNDLKGKIALIVNADPGYDWILGSGIKGFITCYGGPNSHMAVRAMELNLPAVIGVGERLFKKWSEASSLEIDCAGKKVIVLT